VAALVAAGYEVFAINPKATARYQERHSMSGAVDSADGEAIKLLARSHQSVRSATPPASPQRSTHAVD